MALHIGKLIAKKIGETGMTKSELGRRINVTPQNIHYILRNNSIDTDLLRKVSIALDYDFFQHYLGLKPEGKTNDKLINITSGELKIQLNTVKQEIETLKLRNGYLREIVVLIDPRKEKPALKTNHQKKKKDM
jgi:transcriptional regulator with XRE-family HTH domain